MCFFKIHEASLSLSLKVSANAKKDEIKAPQKDSAFLHIKVCAQRERGKANDSLIELLSEHLGVSKGSIRLVRGATASQKVVMISSKNPQKLLDKLL